MIIIEGPDHTGKTRLAKKLSEQFFMPYLHFTKDSTYKDYLTPLCGLSLRCTVADRWAFSEHPYSTVMERKFAFPIKEWHNIILLTLAHNPLVILCTHKPSPEDYSKDQYLPYDRWDYCLSLYRQFFNNHHIKYIEYDYPGPVTAKALAILGQKYTDQMAWWEPMWKSGYGFIGSHSPKYLLVAERIGPNNLNNLPFETGPTGHMLTDMLEKTDTPLGDFAVTNMVKSFRRDTRPPNEQDEELLRVELEHLKPEVAVFMGSVAKRSGAKVAKDLGIKTVSMTHFGYYSHRGISDISPLCNQWVEIIGKKEIENEEARHRTIISST